MTRAQFETAKEVMSSIKYLERISEILKNEEDPRFKLSYFSKETDHMTDVDLSYLDKNTADDILEAIQEVIDNRLKMYNRRLEEL